MRLKKILSWAALVILVVIGIFWLPDEDGTVKHPASATRRAKKRLISTTNQTSVARDRIDAARAVMESRKPGGLKDSRQRSIRIAGDGGDVESDWVDEDGNPWPKEELDLMHVIHDASQEEDYEALASVLDNVVNCSNAEIREKFVDELGWFGEQALSDLTYFLSDANENVVEAARTQFVDAFQGIDDDAEKAALMTTLSKAISDVEVLDSLTDELMSLDELLALQTISDIIETGTSQAAAAAKEMYSTITDETWTDIDAAENWLQENYVDKEDHQVEKVDDSSYGERGEAGG